MCCPVSPDFWQPFLLNEAPFLQKKRLKTLKTGLDRQERVVQACQNIRIPRHSLSQPVFSMFFTPFFLCFWPLYNHSGVCQNRVEGLLTLVQGSVEAVQGHFCTLPIKICLLMANLVPHWSNTTKRFLRNTIFAAVSGKDTAANQFYNTLTCCTNVQHMGRARKMRKGDGAGVEKEANCQKLQQLLVDFSIALLSATSPLSTAPTDEDMSGDLLRDEPMGLNPCSDSIDNLLMVLEPTQLMPGASQRSGQHNLARMHFWVKKNNGLDVGRCAVRSKKIHIGRGTH